MTDFALLESQKSRLVATLAGWSAECLAFRPAPGEWSAIEILDHLARTESSILERTRAGLAHPHAVGIRDRAGVFFIDRIFRSDRKVKVPGTAAQILPDNDATVPAILDRWEATRVELGALLDKIGPADLRGGVFRHPVAGWMTVPQMLNFLSSHMVHHDFQLARLTRAFESARDVSAQSPSR